MKIKNKKIFFIIAILFLFLTKESVLASTKCSCADKDKNQTEVIGNLSDEALCSHTCASKNHPFYKFSDWGPLAKYKPSQLLNTTLISEPTPESTANYATGPFTYVPMEEIPGFGRPADFPGYIMAIYKFGLWTVGMAAMLMITVGGYMYLTSGGNTSQTGKAKEIITDSIAAIILALVSWLILYVINPDLVNFHQLQPISGAPGQGAAGIPGTPSGPGGTTKGYLAACPDPSSNSPIDYSKAASDGKISPNSKCDKYNFSNSSGVDPKILRSIAQLESSCGANKGPSSSNACGLMQILPKTASQLAGRTITCSDLINNDALSIDLAAKYVRQGSNSSCAAKAKNKTAAIFAGYNSGYGCTGKACSPKHALCSSSDCSGALAFECCINPGGLEESINYAWNGVGLMSK